LEQSNYAGSLTGLTALLKTMEQSGLIRRDVRGKRCYEIALTGTPTGRVETAPEDHFAPTPTTTPVLSFADQPPVGALSSPDDDQIVFEPKAPPSTVDVSPVDVSGVDVSALAQALLDRVIKIASTPERDGTETEQLKTEFADLQTRLFEAVERSERQRQRIRLLEDEIDARNVEVRGLRQRLRDTERNLDAILKSPHGVRLDPHRERELNELIRLMRTPPGVKN
jgi:hypothetical protein